MSKAQDLLDVIGGMINESSSINVNIGIDKHRKDFRALVKKVEAMIDKLGGEFDNEGSSKDTYNINANFVDIKVGTKFAQDIEKIVDFVETQTFK